MSTYSSKLKLLLTSIEFGGKNFNFFNSNIAGGRNARPFSICIMDEASQCVEPEALVPLKLGK